MNSPPLNAVQVHGQEVYLVDECGTVLSISKELACIL